MVLLGRNLLGQPLDNAEVTILEKFMRACFNDNPPISRKASETWDVCILLVHLIKLGCNYNLSFSDISGKLFVQLLLTQMCQSSEVAQLDLSQMRIYKDELEFVLQHPTKTFNMKNYRTAQGLQTMSICKFEGNPLLCPMTTLLAYIEHTRGYRKSVSKVFVLVTSGSPRPASKATLICWRRSILNGVGLGRFTMLSTRSASASTGLVMGVPFDQLMAKVGWQKASTFLRSYMKPLLTRDNIEKSNRHTNPQRKESNPPHKTSNGKETLHPKPPIETRSKMFDKHNFCSIFTNKTPRIESHNQAKLIDFVSEHRGVQPKITPNPPVYGPIPTPEHTITLADVEDVILQDRHDRVENIPQVQNDKLQTSVMEHNNLSNYEDLNIESELNMDMPTPSPQSIIELDSSTHSEESISGAVSLDTDRDNQDMLYSLEKGSGIKIHEAPVNPSQDSNPTGEHISMTGDCRDNKANNAASCEGDKREGPVSTHPVTSVGLLTAKSMLKDIKEWGPPPYDEPYWPGNPFESSFLRWHLIEPNEYPINFHGGRKPEAVLGGVSRQSTLVVKPLPDLTSNIVDPVTLSEEQPSKPQLDHDFSKPTLPNMGVTVSMDQPPRK